MGFLSSQPGKHRGPSSLADLDTLPASRPPLLHQSLEPAEDTTIERLKSAQSPDDDQLLDHAHEPAEPPITALLAAWTAGDQLALERLIPLVAAELRRLARRYLARERPGHTLEPTALINELYLRLIDGAPKPWRNRAHFFGFAATTMRHILVDHARARMTARRGGQALRVTFDEALDHPVERDLDLLALDQALETLAELDPRQSRIVELRAFAGLRVREIAEVLGLSEATVNRDWAMARAWLHEQLTL